MGRKIIKLYGAKKNMGNADLLFIFNDLTTIIIKGTNYNNPYNSEALAMAIKKYEEMADSEIKEWYKAEAENPEMVNKDFCPEIYWEIKSIKKYQF